jgi:hypothetical protein
MDIREINGEIWSFGDFKVRIGEIYLGEVTKRVIMQVEYEVTDKATNHALITEFVKQVLPAHLQSGFIPDQATGSLKTYVKQTGQSSAD